MQSTTLQKGKIQLKLILICNLEITRVIIQKPEAFNKSERARETNKVCVGKEKAKKTFFFLKMLLGSVVTIQPSRQPGTTHLLDIAPRVRTGTISPKTPIGTKGLFPKVKWSYTSSDITIIPNFFAVFAICDYKQSKDSQSIRKLYTCLVSAFTIENILSF
jgi:hypothetical protein